jgi:hypothetical protein
MRDLMPQHSTWLRFGENGIATCIKHPVLSSYLEPEMLCSSRADQFAGVLAIIGTGVTNLSWSNDVNTLCHRAGSFFVSIGADRSE